MAVISKIGFDPSAGSGLAKLSHLGGSLSGVEEIIKILTPKYHELAQKQAKKLV